MSTDSPIVKTARAARQVNRGPCVPVLALLPRRCPRCGRHTIIGHGQRRKQAHEEHHDWIWVRRGFCRPCGETFTILPTWSSPYGQYSLRYRQQAWESSCHRNAAWEQACTLADRRDVVSAIAVSRPPPRLHPNKRRHESAGPQCSFTDTDESLRSSHSLPRPRYQGRGNARR